MRLAVAIVFCGTAIFAAKLPKPGPDYARLDVDVPTKFSSATKASQAENEAALAHWWLALGDAKLNSMITRAVASNLNLKIAGLRLQESRAARRIVRADQLPTVESSDSIQRIRGGFNQGIIHINRQGGAPGIISAFETNSFQLGFDALWEIDFFGGKRLSLKAATAETQVSQEARHDVLLSLIAEVARDYSELRGAQRRLGLTRENIELQKDSLHLTQVRAEAGLGNELDLERQRTQLESTQAIVPQLETTISQAIHALSILLSLEPSALQNELASPAPLTAPSPDVPAGLPASLLRRRPDIRQAEAEVAAAMARIGIARADFFPKITLTGSAGRQSADWPGFTFGAGNFFSIGPGVKLPLYTGGRLKANLEVQRLRFAEAQTAYRSTVLASLRETEDSLTAYHQERERRDRLDASVRSSRETVKLAREVYTSGLSDFLGVLDAQRQQLVAENDLVVSETAIVTDLISLYKALGGGWEVTP